VYYSDYLIQSSWARRQVRRFRRRRHGPGSRAGSARVRSRSLPFFASDAESLVNRASDRAWHRRPRRFVFLSHRRAIL